MKTLALNEKALEELIEQVGYEPSNVVILNYLKDNEAVIINSYELKQQKYVLLPPTEEEKWFIKDGFYKLEIKTDI